MTKTVREFASSASIWPLVDEWARSQRLLFAEDTSQPAAAAISEDSPKTRTYKATSPVSLMASYIRIIQVGDSVRVEGWKTPREQAIESFSILGVANPDNFMAKPAFNKLLEKLGQPRLGAKSKQQMPEVTVGSAMREYVGSEEEQKGKERRLRQAIILTAWPWFVAGLVVVIIAPSIFGEDSPVCYPGAFLGIVLMIVGCVKAIRMRIASR